MLGEGKYVPCCLIHELGPPGRSLVVMTEKRWTWNLDPGLLTPCAMIFPHSQVAIDGEDGGEDEDNYCLKQWEKLKFILYERAGFTF